MLVNELRRKREARRTERLKICTSKLCCLPTAPSPSLSRNSTVLLLSVRWIGSPHSQMPFVTACTLLPTAKPARRTEDEDGGSSRFNSMLLPLRYGPATTTGQTEA